MDETKTPPAREGWFVKYGASLGGWAYIKHPLPAQRVSETGETVELVYADGRPRTEIYGGLLAACPKCVEESHAPLRALESADNGLVRCPYHGLMPIKEVCDRIFGAEKSETPSHSGQPQSLRVQSALNTGGTS